MRERAWEERAEARGKWNAAKWSTSDNNQEQAVIRIHAGRKLTVADMHTAKSYGVTGRTSSSHFTPRITILCTQ